MHIPWMMQLIVYPKLHAAVNANAVIMRSWTLLAAFGGSYAPGIMYIHVTALGVLCCFAVVVCLTLLLSFFLLHLSLTCTVEDKKTFPFGISRTMLLRGVPLTFYVNGRLKNRN